MKIISFFCGAGGMDLGFMKAGHEIIYANDIDKDSCKTYERNLGHAPICKSILELPSDKIPNGDVVIGGFPCQGFSIANPYRNTKDERNSLYLQLLRIIKDKQPKYFVAENVPGICSIGGYKTNADKKNKEGRVLKMILEDFKNAGYRIEWKILNSADFGVPQIRKRVIILGTRNDVKYTLKHPEPINSKTSRMTLDGKKINKWLTVKDALKGLPEQPTESIPNHVGTAHKVKINGHLGNRKTDQNKPAPTIVGRGGGTGGPVIIPHPNLKRRMTVRECARLQNFPDDFIFEGAISSQYRQIGNAVPWPLAYHVAKMLPRD